MSTPAARAATDVIVRTVERQPGNVVRVSASTCVKCGPHQPIRAYNDVRQCGACGIAWTVSPSDTP